MIILREPIKNPRISQEFGAEFLWFNWTTRTYYNFYESFGLKGHPGIDYGCPSGTPIYAAHDGTVMYAGYDSINGNLVQIWNEELGFKTLYGHNSQFKCSVGDVVKAGDLISLSGATGEGTGPHLHFGMKMTGAGGNGLNNNNGYNGANDPIPYIQLTYDGKSIYNNMDTAKFCRDNDLKWIRNSKTGAFGRIMQGELKTFSTNDRAVLAILDGLVRTSGLNITDEIWNQLPKNNF